ncbi:MAG: RHS repeat-associated core domain-containing protein [Dehalococcoidia bacterium]|nr:RHS repeat-associated core domain-containing protein [Dehalococcoidia bacterium]
MVEATVNSMTSTFAYRGDGLRDSRTAGMTTTQFTWDINAGLPVVLDDGPSREGYLYGAGLSAMKQSGNWFYYLADGLGSTMAIVDSSGNSQKTYEYDVYGDVTGGSGGLSNEFDFAGQQTDPTGLQYLRARYYDPETGSFLSRDPLEEVGGTGTAPFGYSAGRPTVLSDPTGLAPWDSGEVQWCARHPAWWPRCARGAFWARFAMEVTTRAFGAETDLSDAFRHCLWSACLTIDLGAVSAKTLTDTHERFDTSGNRQEQRKDLWNNAIGRLIGNAASAFGPEYAVRHAATECANQAAAGGLLIDPALAPPFPGEAGILPGYGGGSW